VVIGDGGSDMSVMIAGRTDGMNNYQDATRKEILDFITIRCKDCAGLMKQFKIPQGFRGFYCLTCDRELVLTEV